jgi:hypothetical protein
MERPLAPRVLHEAPNKVTVGSDYCALQRTGWTTQVTAWGEAHRGRACSESPFHVLIMFRLIQQRKV